MADDAVERVRREFAARAPELRRELVAELAAILDRAALTPDETAVLRHLLAHAGYSLDGGLYIPALSVLWGGEPSYLPPAPLPADRARAAAVILRRRGVLRDADGHTGGVVLDADVVRGLAVKAAGGPKRRVVLFVAATLDGYIAGRDGDTGWLSQVEAPPEDYGYAEFIKTVDSVVMGRKTYESILASGREFPHKGRKVYVLSRKKKGSDADVAFFRGDPAKLISRLREQPGRDIYCDGGASVIHALLKEDLIDVLIVSLVPVLLGDGIPLFKRGRAERRLQLISSRSFPTGLVQLRYERL